MQYVVIELETEIDIPGLGTRIAYEICQKANGPDGELGPTVAFAISESMAEEIVMMLNYHR